MRRSRKSYCWWWSGEVFSGRIPTASLRKIKANRIPEKKRGRIRVEHIRCPRGGSEFHLPPFNVNPSVTPKKQPSRRSSKEYSDAVKDEVTRLKQAGTIKEVFYLEWLFNTVVVKKKSGKWRVCVDFTDLNKAYPKDSFLMPRIDHLVVATIDHPQMSFLNAFQGYH